MADIKVVDESEVWWASTKEYTLDVGGEIVSCRIAESSKETEFFEWTENSGWVAANIDNGVMHVIYNAWSNGELSEFNT